MDKKSSYLTKTILETIYGMLDYGIIREKDYEKIKQYLGYDEKKDISSDIEGIRCSVQRALLGYVTPNLRAVYVILENNGKYHLIFYYDKGVTEDEEELACYADTEFIADFPFQTDYSLEIIEYPEKIPEEGICIYARWEPSPPPTNAIIIISVQRALQGRVTPNLRAVNVDLTKYILTFYYDKDLFTDEEKLANLVGNAYIADFPHHATYTIKVLAYPQRIPNDDLCLYLRWEPSH